MGFWPARTTRIKRKKHGAWYLYVAVSGGKTDRGPVFLPLLSLQQEPTRPFFFVGSFAVAVLILFFVCPLSLALAVFHQESTRPPLFSFWFYFPVAIRLSIYPSFYPSCLNIYPTTLCCAACTPRQRWRRRPSRSGCARGKPSSPPRGASATPCSPLSATSRGGDGRVQVPTSPLLPCRRRQRRNWAPRERAEE